MRIRSLMDQSWLLTRERNPTTGNWCLPSKNQKNALSAEDQKFENFAARCLCLLAAFAVTATPAFAHANTGVGVGFVSGFGHPLTGIDHILAMVAVGIWGTQLGRPAIWLLPVTFPLVMSIGGVLGVRGVPIPGVEIGVAASAVVLGVMILLAARPPLWVAAALVGAFAIFHGHAHGTELPKAAYPLAYGVGFVLSTGVLHVTGITLGLIDRWPIGARSLRGIGAAIGASGLYLLVVLTK
jgi:urease accessory protein